VEWEPLDWLRFRGTRSRDIRAPNLFELYGAPQSSFQTVDDPANGGVRNLIPTLLGGNSTLQPEEADTWTVGGVLTAGFGSAGALRLSLDRFDIEVDGVIATLGAQAIVVRCFQGDAALCQYVTRGTNNLLAQILNPQLNLQSLVTRLGFRGRTTRCPSRRWAWTTATVSASASSPPFLSDFIPAMG
jgi:outer membrane receptor protein involved in Fe transport